MIERYITKHGSVSKSLLILVFFRLIEELWLLPQSAGLAGEDSSNKNFFMSSGVTDSADLIEKGIVAKPPRYSGEEKDWQIWCFRFNSFAAVCGWQDYLDKAKNCTDEIVYDDLGKDAKICAVTVYHFLVQHVDGRALGVVHLVDPPNGLEAWRQLCKEYEPDIGGRLASALRNILRPDWWNDSDDFRKSLITWDNQVLAYERASGEPVSQRIKAAIVMEYAPASVKQAIQLSDPGIREDYARLRDALQHLYDAQRPYTPPHNFTGPSYVSHQGGPQPMEVGAALVAGAFNGKGGKGSGAAVGGQQQFQGDCGYCGKWGHKRIDCRQRQFDEAGKGKGKPKDKGKVKGKFKEKGKDKNKSKNPTGVAAALGQQPAPEPPTKVVAAATYEATIAKADAGGEQKWVMAAIAAAAGDFCKIPAGKVNEYVKVLGDSGSDEHMCPKDFAKHIPLMHLKEKPHHQWH